MFQKGKQVIIDAENHVLFKDYRFQVREIEDIKSYHQFTMIKIKGIVGYHPSEHFKLPKVEPEFKIGDSVTYLGVAHEHLIKQQCTVEKLFTWDGGTLYNFKFKEFPRFYSACAFKKSKAETGDFENIKEVILGLCNKGDITETTQVHLNLINEKAKTTCYTKNDLMSVLRVLDKYHVAAELNFLSDMNDALTVSLLGEDIMEELGSDEPKTMPVAALLEISNLLDPTITIDGHNFIYIVGFDGIIYEKQEYNLPTVQATSE